VRYQAQNTEQRGSIRLGKRVQDWESFYDIHSQPALNTSTVETESDPVTREWNPEPDSANTFATDPADEMVIVDVAIIESQEDTGTRKGVNLLDGLKVQYGLDRITTDVKSKVSTDGIDSAVDTYSRSLTKAISIPQLEYSLNIFNSATFKNQVLARPTLVALNGHPSRFFSGSNVQAAATASSTVGAVSGGAAVKINEDIGINMIITPTLGSGDLVRIDVEVTRTFLETPDAAIDFEFKIQTDKTHVSASIVMAFGETLILSGMSEKQSETFRDGVPVLQDIPFLQYFFSEERTLDFQRSALVLITPRRPITLNSIVDERSQQVPGDGNDNLSQLQRRFDSWFKPAPAWVSVVQHLEKGELYREFRTGDLALEQWAESQAFRNRFGDVVEFLYY
jgi:type II secretory pathway component GspD/PulD (secretin)